MILAESLDKNENNLDNTLEDFSLLINNSKIKSRDWIVGGNLSPFNSKAGFDEIVKRLKNKSPQ